MTPSRVGGVALQGTGRCPPAESVPPGASLALTFLPHETRAEEPGAPQPSPGTGRWWACVVSGCYVCGHLLQQP